MSMILTIEQTAKMYGVSVETIKAQYAANAKGLETLLAKAVATGKKVNGYTAEQLEAKIAEYKELAK